MKARTAKALVLADLHLSNSLPHTRPLPGVAGMTDRFRDQLDALDRIRERGGFDFVIVLGDFWDKRLLDAVTLCETLALLKRFEPMPFWILPGNHDAHGASAQNYTVEAFKSAGLEHVRCLEAGVPFTSKEAKGWLNFWPLPFMPLGRTREHLEIMREGAEESNGFNVLLLHQSIKGCKVSESWTCDEGLTPEEATECFDLTLAGHFHGSQAFGDNGSHYVGAPWQRSYEHEGQPDDFKIYSFREVQFKKGGAKLAHEIETVDSGTPRFWATEDLDSLTSKPGDFIRHLVRMTPSEWEREKGRLQARTDQMSRDGFRATCKLVPVSHHKERLALGDGKEASDWNPDKLVPAYVDSEDVETGALDARRLKRLGQEILKEAIGGGS